jgi:hypothetical protein
LTGAGLRLLAVAVAVAALAFAAPALADTTYHDATGEDPNAADITTVVASNDQTGDVVAFQITVANAAAVKADTSFFLYFNTDRDDRTGNPQGFEYAAALFPVGWAWAKWDGSQWVTTDAFVQGIFLDDVMTVSIANQGLGDLKSFDFEIVSVRGDPNDPHVDAAPEVDQIWTYTLTKATVGTPTQPVTKTTPPARVRSTTATFAGTPTGGTSFAVTGLTVALSTGAQKPASKVACTATLGGKALKGTGAGHCTFKLPKTAKGQRLSVHVTGTYGTTKLGRTYAFKVR